MVRDEYPGQEEGEAEKDMLKETVQPEEDNRDNAGEDHRDEAMEWSEDYSDQLTEHLEVDAYTVGFKMLDNELDRLNSFLDDLEQKNDNIHAELVELLRSNREVRQQFQGSSLQTEEQQSDQQS
ncbi:hypothetical protein DMN91_010449 [Ooceraea biroi]|uniref:Uncharacterized protein n=2 Tax=Ooceraea biroi TaxID=2015173 RepID=A0A026WSM7_OOCBI|nr:hypothetical protein X777_16997 [Ooceraea biroi]RLU16381.1 hypothetical protein DMN91_010449 [Ooceraea biroi]